MTINPAQTSYHAVIAPLKDKWLLIINGKKIGVYGTQREAFNAHYAYCTRGKTLRAHSPSRPSKAAVFVAGMVVGVLLVAAWIGALTWCDNNLNAAPVAVVTEAEE